MSASAAAGAVDIGGLRDIGGAMLLCEKARFSIGAGVGKPT